MGGSLEVRSFEPGCFQTRKRSTSLNAQIRGLYYIGVIWDPFSRATKPTGLFKRSFDHSSYPRSVLLTVADSIETSVWPLRRVCGAAVSINWEALLAGVLRITVIPFGVYIGPLDFLKHPHEGS